MVKKKFEHAIEYGINAKQEIRLSKGRVGVKKVVTSVGQDTVS